MSGRRSESIEGAYGFSDLIDITTVSKLVDSFFKATGIPNGLVAPNGELITQSGWIDACARFHRGNPETNRLCKESNLDLMDKVCQGEVAGCLCKNGLYDYATPIVIEGKQVATLFLGQVLDGPPDMEFFRKQALRFGFDEDAYLDAIRAVPIVSKEQLQAHLEHMVSLVQILAESGLTRLHETRLKEDLHKSKERRIQMDDLLEFSPVGISWSDSGGNIEYVNRQFTELFGYTLDELPDLETWVGKAYPDAEYRNNIINPLLYQIEANQQPGALLPEFESTITCKDKSERHVVTRVSAVGGKLLANFTDISARWKSEQRNRAHDTILEMIAKAKSLPHILHAIVEEIEAEIPDSFGSVLLLDQEGKHLLTGAAPHLPKFYNEAVNGIEIGMGVGSCGTAAYLGKRVVVEDIATHEYWRSIKELAKQAGVAACWSEPIIASDDKVLGTFAIYHRHPASPSEDDIQLITFASNLAAIAIENSDTREALIVQERKFRTLAENAPIIIVRYDRKGRLIYANPKLAATFSMPVEQVLRQQASKPSELPEVPNKAQFQEAIARTVESGEEITFEIELPNLNGDIETHFITMVPEKDESGVIVGVLSTGLDISDRKRLEHELEHQAHVDFLTELVNRRHFLELTKTELVRLDRYHGNLSLILFDIDRFKRINDTHGHCTGDLVLQKIAQISRETVREIDVVGRFGGEEFVVLLPQTNRQQACEVAERLRHAIAEGEIYLANGEPVQFTASLGVATISKNEDPGEDAASFDDLLKQADSAMYQAKKEGRNRVCLTPAS